MEIPIIREGVSPDDSARPIQLFQQAGPTRADGTGKGVVDGGFHPDQIAVRQEFDGGETNRLPEETLF